MHPRQSFSLPALLASRSHRHRPLSRRAILLVGACLTALALVEADVAQAQEGPLIYVPNAGSNDVSVIDTSTNTVAPTPVVVQLGPVAAAVRGDQSLAYVTNFGSNTVSVIDTQTNAVVATIPVGDAPAILSLSPDNTRVYVANQGSNAVSVIDATSNTVVATIAVGSQPVAPGVTPDGTRVYVTNVGSDTVSVIDTATNTVTANIPVGAGPTVAAVTPDGTRAYVANSISGNVSVISTSTNTVIATIPLGVGVVPQVVAISPNGSRLYVTDASANTVSVIDVATNTVVTSIALGNQPLGIVVTPDGSRAYVTNSADGTVSIIDTATNTVVGTLPAGTSPSFLGVCSNGNALLAAGRTFRANTGGAVACTQASGPTGSAGPVFTGGTLLIAGTSVTSALPISLQAEGGIIDTNGNNATFSGAISGPGTLSKTGAGILTLSGQSTYTGATAVNAGTLQAGAVNAFSPSSAFSVAGGAVLDLAGFNQTIGSLAGAGAVTLGAATLVTGNDNTSTIYSGVMSGSGGLTKIGTGVLMLTGNSAFTGATTVNSGGLVVNGSLASAVTVNGGTLSGDGSVGALVANGGFVAPGNSIGTFTVNGNFTQNGGVYQVEVNAAGQGDRISVAGTATINGGSVQVLAQNGTYARNTTYTILNATGGLSGAYSGVSSNFAFLTPSLSYDANNVYLLLFQSASAFAAGAQTANQFAVGTALDQANASATGDFNTVLNALSVLGVQQGPAALNTVGGQPYADFGTMNVQSAALFMNAVGRQMAGARGAASGGQRQALAEACDVAACDTAGPWAAWVSGLGGLGSVAGNGNSNTLVYNFGGAAAGIDYRLDPRFLVGLGVSYAAGNQWVDSFLGRGWTNSVGVMAYGSFVEGAFYADALAGYAYSNNQLQRQIVISGLQPRTANGSTGANQFLGQVEVGYKVPVFAPAAPTVTPFARFQWSTVTQNSFSEWGAQSLSLNVAQQTTNSLRSTFGADLAGAIGLSVDRKLDLALRLGWLHEYAETGRPITGAFAGAPSNGFTVYGATPQRDSALIAFSAGTAITASTQIHLRYQGEVGSNSDNHTFNLGVRLVW